MQGELLQEFGRGLLAQGYQVAGGGQVLLADEWVRRRKGHAPPHNNYFPLGRFPPAYLLLTRFEFGAVV